MFERRLTWFWIMLTALAAVIVARLAQIQIGKAAEHEALADRILSGSAIYIPAPRGSVLDRNGVVLVRDEPTYDICMHYGALVLDRNYLVNRAARALRSRGDVPAETPLRSVADALPGQIDAAWERLAELTDLPREVLDANASRVIGRVQRWRRTAGQPIREENQHLPVIEGVATDVALAVRLELEHLPWLRVHPSSRRIAFDVDAAAHLVGRLGEASAARIAADPLRDDELRGLRPGDACGVSGVERLGEASLRGRRGRIREGYDGRLLDRLDPAQGRDVYLTIDIERQRQVVAMLAEAVDAHPDRTGAAAVVIDVATREVLVLASYPTYRFDHFNEDYAELRRDAIREPLRFRAVASTFPPGSICKAITMVGALTDGKVTPGEPVECTGHLLPNAPDRFRCWIYKQYGTTHGVQDAPTAIRNSCNIYFFKMGDRLGPGRLCEWFDAFGLGRAAGTGLIEESAGVNPTPAWLSDPRRAVPRQPQPADAWFFAIGQGEVTITPLQAANVAASVASGLWMPVRLAYDDEGSLLGGPVVPPTRFAEEPVSVVRDGMWRVVNDAHGTARQARLKTPGQQMCGKTGSAQAVPRAVQFRWTFEWPDGTREERLAYTEEDARADLGDEQPRLVGRQTVARFPMLPEGADLPTHAWFIGFTQPRNTPRGRAPQGRSYAVSVIIEYGGGGGAVAAPVARDIADLFLTAPEAPAVPAHAAGLRESRGYMPGEDPAGASGPADAEPVFDFPPQ